jgi:hypothetical protein
VTTSTKFGLTSGGLLVGRQEIILPPEYMQMLAAFAETSGVVDLGLHCSRCGQDLRGANGRGDARWIMECACRTFVGANPLPRGH